MKSKRILYGVPSEGMGHAIRSSVIIDYLLSLGHDVRIVSSGKAATFLAKKYKHVVKAHGMSIAYKNNEVDKVNTIIANLKESKNLVKNSKLISSEFKNFKPELVITDFDSAVSTFAKLNNIPCISIDNIQAINRCKLDKDLKIKSGYSIAKNVVKFKTPWCKRYCITSFVDLPIKKKKTKLFDPIIRKEILEAKTSIRKHILIYQTSESNQQLINLINLQAPQDYTYIVYGLKRDLTSEEKDGNVIYKPFSESSFINDLASCTAVVSGGGFTVITEALYLKKPVYSIPIGGQFEQEMNAYYLEKLGFGKYCKDIKSFDIQSFMSSIPFYQDNLVDYTHDENKKLFKFLKKLTRSL